MQHNHLLLHLSLIPSIGPVTIEKIIAAIDVEKLDQIYKFSCRDFSEICRISAQAAEALVKGLADKQLLATELQLAEKHNIQWITIFDAVYPPLLKQIHLPPTILYVQGSVELLSSPCLAMVGSRKAQSYARRTIQSFVPDLIQASQTLVSGGALGADTMVHEVALAQGGKTIAVLGSGLLKPYPSSNKKLFSQIIDSSGALISPFSLTMQAMPGNFPARNRIIAGLSTATIVIQAAEKSGALITALFALEQGREVGAVPGLIDDSLSVGCHKLLQQGAAVITAASDIFAMLGHQIPMAQKYTVSPAPVLVPKPRNSQHNDPLLELCRQPQSFDELLVKTALAVPQLQEKLLHFQLNGQLEQDFIGRWTCLS